MATAQPGEHLLHSDHVALDMREVAMMFVEDGTVKVTLKGNSTLQVFHSPSCLQMFEAYKAWALRQGGGGKLD